MSEDERTTQQGRTLLWRGSLYALSACGAQGVGEGVGQKSTPWIKEGQ